MVKDISSPEPFLINKIMCEHDMPASLFCLLDGGCFQDIVEYVGRDGYKNNSKIRVAWYWQYIALLMIFSKEKSMFLIVSFLSIVGNCNLIPTDSAALKCVDAIECFNKKYSFYMGKALPEVTKISKLYICPDVIQKNLIICARIFKVFYEALQEYTKGAPIAETCASFYEKFRNDQGHLIDEILKNSYFYTDPSFSISTLNEKNGLEFLQIIATFCGIVGNSYNMRVNELNRKHYNSAPKVMEIFRALYWNFKSNRSALCLSTILDDCVLQHNFSQLLKKIELEKSSIKPHLKEQETPIISLSNSTSTKKQVSIPETFIKDYIKLRGSENSNKKLGSKYKIKSSTLRKWKEQARKELNFPKKIQIEPLFAIKLFGYEISLGMKKIEPPEPVDMSDELKDFIEY